MIILPLNITTHENNYQGTIQLLKDWTFYQTYRNRQIAAFLVGQKQKSNDLPNYHNLDRHILNHIAQCARWQWKNDTIEKIHEAADRERAFQILCLTYQRFIKDKK